MTTSQELSKMAANGLRQGKTKADVARSLLALGYTVSDISKAVPMAYSQVHSIAKASQPTEAAMQAGLPGQVRGHKPPPPVGQAKVGQSSDQFVLRSQKQRRQAVAREIVRAPAKLKVGKLPNDIAVGECANCGFDIVVRPGPYGYMLVHTGASAEDYLSTIQFCQAVPKKLL